MQVASRASLDYEDKKQLARVNKQKEKLYGITFASAAILGALEVLVSNAQPTWCTDGVKIYISTKFTALMTDLEIRGVLLHEELHCSLLHPLRLTLRPLSKYPRHIVNVAADYIINGKIRRMNGYGIHFVLPSDAMFHPVYSADDSWSLEAVCADMMKDEAQNPPPPPPPGPEQEDEGEEVIGNPGLPTDDDEGDLEGEGPASDEDSAEDQDGDQEGGSGGKEKGEHGEEISTGSGCGDIIPHPGGEGATAEEVQQIVADMTERIANAAVLEKSVSDGKGGSGGVYSKISNSDVGANVIPASVVKPFLVKASSRKMSMNRPNRRWLMHGMHLPGRTKNNCELINVIDSSGSVSLSELKEFRNQLIVWCKELGISKIRTAYVDSVVHLNPETDEPWFDIDVSLVGADNIELDVFGGGATSFDPIFEYIKEHQEQVSGLVYMTDGYGNVEFERPEYPVLWVTNSVPPTFWNQSQWGEIVYM